MTSIREFLAKDSLATSDATLRHRSGIERFSKFLDSTVDPVWPQVLARFAEIRPWTYWDPQALDMALSVLEQSPERTFQAISIWSRRVGIGFESLLRLAPIALREESLSLDKTPDLFVLANEFHPEYLRCCEHIFINLLVVYWAVLKKGDVTGKYEISGAVSRIESAGHSLLLSGYEDRIRNAIAHGEVVFRGFGIQYGDPIAKYELPAYEFLQTFDSLWRTANSLGIALLLFLARNIGRASPASKVNLPTGIISLIVAASVERIGLAVSGVLESEIALGRQLHISFQTVFRNRTAILLECYRISLHLMDNGAVGYSRFLFNVEHGEKISSMAVILADRLEGLMKLNAPFERIGEALDPSQLLWYDEPSIITHAKIWGLSFAANWKRVKEEIKTDWQKRGLFPAAGRYFIRKVENVSAGGTARLKAVVVLKHSSDADDREMLREIIRSAINKLSKKWIETNPSKLVKRWNWRSRPKYVWVSLYRLDGTLRWLEAGGWPGGNLIVTAERVFDAHRAPIFVKKPDEMWKGIRFQYSMDAQVIAKSGS